MLLQEKCTPRWRPQSGGEVPTGLWLEAAQPDSALLLLSSVGLLLWLQKGCWSIEAVSIWVVTPGGTPGRSEGRFVSALGPSRSRPGPWAGGPAPCVRFLEQLATSTFLSLGVEEGEHGGREGKWGTVAWVSFPYSFGKTVQGG